VRRVKKAFPTRSADVPVPGGSGHLVVTARLLYRKADQYLLNFMFGPESGLTAPITEMSSVTKVVRVEGPTPRGAAAGGMP
jgi:hypothetical protein